MPGESDEELEIRHVLFIDIVGYSKLLIEEQKARLRRLTEIVLATAQVNESTDEQLVRLPTGDGMALVFRKSAEEPAQCALEVARGLKAHREIKVRMGIHSGPVSEVTDLNARTNIAGSGINLAQRVMDCGDAGHILLSRRVADDLEQFTRWKPFLHALGECRVKHDVRLQLANLYTDDAGNPEPPQKFRRARRLRVMALLGTTLLAAIAVGLAAFFLHRSVIAPEAKAIPEKSIAVLPFENLSDDQSNAYFAAGIQDEILTRLANLRDLKVIARTSTEKYESHPSDLRAIGAELGVAHILEGSVQKVGQEVHVNVQLIRARTAAHVWAQSYDRTLEHVFAVQGEVAETVANALQVALEPAQIEKLKALPTRNVAAYDFYLKGEYALEQAWKNPGDYEQVFEPAIANLHEAISADPQFALAYARLAEAELAKEYFGHADGGVVHRPELLASAKRNIDRALKLQPDLPAAHLAQGRWFTLAKHDRDAALQEYQRVLAQDPRQSLASLRIATTAISKGHPEEAIALLSKALELDPRNFQLLRTLSIACTIRRDYQRAAEVDARIVALNPADELDATNLALDLIQSSGDVRAAQEVLDSLLAHLPAGPKSARVTAAQLALLTYRRDFTAAKRYVEKLPPESWRTDWDKQLALGELERYLGDKASARAAFESARALVTAAIAKEPEEPQLHADLGKIHAELGAKDEALRAAQRAIDLEPVEKDERNGTPWLLNLATVHTLLGRKDEALAILERLMAMPHAGDTIAAWQLQLDPVWDPLRQDPRFARLVARRAAKP